MKKYLKTISKYLDVKITGSIGTANSLNREEWIRSELLKIDKNLKILDAGAGESQYKKFCAHLQYTSQDIAIYDGAGNREGIQKGKRNYSDLDIISDIYNIPVENSTFDVVLCTEVIEHLPDPIKVFSELNRVLKKDGILILTAPFNSLTHYAPYHYQTGFTPYFYNYHLPIYGFEILYLEPNGNYFDYFAQELRRIKTIAYKYSNIKIGIIYKISIKLLLNFLNKSLLHDTESSELLCYGYHLKCKKISNY